MNEKKQRVEATKMQFVVESTKISDTANDHTEKKKLLTNVSTDKED